MNPPVHHYAGVRYRMNPTLGLPILAAVLSERGHSVKVWDLEALGISPRQLADLYDDAEVHWPDAMGFTVTSHNRRGARECVEALREIGFDRYIVLGGPDVTLEPDRALSWGADAAVVGEAEGNAGAIFEERLAGVIQGEAIPIEDVPGPLWRVHRPQPTEYMGNQPKIGHPEGIAMWSRGCPHSCIFCGNPVFSHQPIRTRPAAKISADMAGLKALGVRSVFVYDDELVGAGTKHNAWLRRVCAEVAPLGLAWKCQGRCSRKNDEETLAAMHAAGCRAIMWGVESFSDKVLVDMKKGMTEADIWHSLETARKAGIGNWLFFMVGNYAETEEDLAYTERRLGEAERKGLVQWRQVTICSPEPGTELWRRAEAEGWLAEQPETGPQMAQTYYDTPWLSAKTQRMWRQRLLVA